MASRGDQVVDALIERLQVPDDLTTLSEVMQALAEEIGELAVDRYPLRPGEGARIRVYPFEATCSPASASITRHQLLVKLELMRLIPDELEADQAVDPLYIWAIRRLLPDQRLGGLATGIREVKRAWGGEERERGHALMLLAIEVTYQTRADDPEARV